MNGFLSGFHEPPRLDVKIQTGFGMSGEGIKKTRGHGQWAAFRGAGAELRDRNAVWNWVPSSLWGF